MDKRFDLLVVGAVALEEALSVPNLPGPGGKVAWTARERRVGGDAACLALQCRERGWTVALAATVGHDAAGQWLQDQLSAAAVDLSALRRVNAETERHWAMVEPDGTRTVFYARVAAMNYPPEALAAAWIASGRQLFVDGSDPVAEAHARALAAAAGVELFVP